MSTEDEPFKEKIFYNPSDYSPIVESFSNGQSMFVRGNRGTGKTAMLYDLKSKADDKKILLTWLDDFTDLGMTFMVEDFYSVIIQKMVKELFSRLANERHRIRLLRSEQKILLVYLLRTFLSSVSMSNLVQEIEKVRHPFLIVWSKKVYNFAKDFLNYGMSVAIQFTSDVIRQHFTQLPPMAKEQVLKKYFPELPYEAERDFVKQNVSYNFLNQCLDLIKSLGFSRFAFIVDKIDEDIRLKNDAGLISHFIEPMLTDNKLLLNEHIQVVISLWSIPFEIIASQVRSQKHFSAKLAWNRDDLEGALNKRLSFFSNGRVNNYKGIFNDALASDLFADIFYLANGNPRDLWHIFKHVFYEQYRLDPKSVQIDRDAVVNALRKFVQEFNYYEYYPRKMGAKAHSLDIYSYIRHLLRLGKTDFTRNAFMEATGVSGGSVNNYVAQMQHMGLIVQLDREGTALKYSVADPKVRYAIDYGLSVTKIG